MREVIDRRLARLSQPCIRMLTLAALDGAVVRPWLLARVLGDGCRPGRPGRGGRSRPGCWSRGTAGPRLRFAHDLFREVLARRCPLAARRGCTATWAPRWRRARPKAPWSTRPSWPPTSGPPRPPGDAEAGEPAVRYAREAAADAPARLAFDDAVAHSSAPWPLLDLPARASARLASAAGVADARRWPGASAAAAATYRDAFAAARQLGDADDRGPRRHRPAPTWGRRPARQPSGTATPRCSRGRRGFGGQPHALAAGCTPRWPAPCTTRWRPTRWPGPCRSPNTPSSSPGIQATRRPPPRPSSRCTMCAGGRGRPGQRLEVLGRLAGSRPARMRAGLRHVTRLPAPRPCSSWATPRAARRDRGLLRRRGPAR